MIKLKNILLESDLPDDLFIPHNIEGRLEKYIQNYIKNGCVGDLNLFSQNLTRFPEILRNIKRVGGGLYCYYNRLETLEYCPEIVEGSFVCSFNNLRSLKYAPKFVGDKFSCFKNPGNFTEADVKAVCEVKGEIIT